MANITYDPQYKPPFYRDNVDLVSAEGPNGFNFQFSALKAEFDQLVQVVSLLNTAIKAAGQKPPVQFTMTLMPVLMPVILGGPSTEAGWGQHIGFVDNNKQASAKGIMTVDFPNVAPLSNQVTINTFRATGRNGNGTGGPGSGNLRISLQRQKVVVDVANPANNNPETIAFLSPTSINDAFDVPAPASDPKTKAVDITSFKYFIFVQLDSAAPSDIVQISAFQITYTISPL